MQNGIRKTSLFITIVMIVTTCSKLFDYDSVFFKAFYEGKNKEKKVFSLKTVSEQFVHEEILNLNPAKSTGLDDIPARFIRDGALILNIPEHRKRCIIRPS